MRPVLHGDVVSAARALLAVEPEARESLCRRIFEGAEVADRHAARTGRLHPFWGNGSLMSAARRRPLATEPDFDNAEYCECVMLVLAALLARPGV